MNHFRYLQNEICRLASARLTYCGRLISVVNRHNKPTSTYIVNGPTCKFRAPHKVEIVNDALAGSG